MSCKPFKTSEANAKSFLRTKKVIDKYLNVKDLGKFRTLHSKLRKQAKEKYFFNDPTWNEKLFLENKQGTKVYPNKAVFTKIDNINGIYYKTEVKWEPNQSVAGVNIGETLKNTYFKNEDSRDALDVINEISKSNHPLNNLAAKLIPYVKLNNVKISLIDGEYKFTKPNGEESRAAGLYLPESNEIHLFSKEQFSSNQMEKLILHEILHALTFHHLRINTTVNKDFNELYEHAKEVFPDVVNEYAMNTLDEFIVGLFTDGDFITKLQQLPPKKGLKKYDNLFEEIFDYILKVLGIRKSSNLYSQAFDVATNVLEEYKLANESIQEQYPVEYYQEQEEYYEGVPQESKSFEPKKEVQELFDSNSELSSIGTVQQYSQYLDTIFPDSQVKDIVYHGSPDTFEFFDENLFGKRTNNISKAIYFTDSYITAKAYAEGDIDWENFESIEEANEFVKSKVYSAILNIENLKITNDIQGVKPTNLKNEGLKTKNKLADTLAVGGVYDEAHQFVVFKPEQIHILGSKQDIEGFKKFVNSKQSKSFEPSSEEDLDEFDFNDLLEEHGLDEEPYIETFDNFETVVNYKKSLISKIKNRIANIQTLAKTADSKEDALAYVKKENELQKRLAQLENDVIDTESGLTVDKLRFQAQKDLERLEVLLDSDNVNDLNEAKRIINFYKAMSFTPNKITYDKHPIDKHPIFFEEEIYGEDGDIILPEKTVKFFEDMSKAFNKYEKRLEKQQKTAIENIFNSNDKVKSLVKKVSYGDLTSNLADISWVDMMIMDISKNTFSSNGLIPQMMMNMTQAVFSEKLNRTKAFEEKHNAALIKAEKALRRMGYGLSVFGSKGVSYDIFFQKSMGRNTGRLVHRYNQEFFDSRSQMLSEFSEKLRLIKGSGLDPKVTAPLYKEAFEEKQKWFRENTIVFNVRSLKEIQEAFPELSEYFDEVDDTHRQEIIDNIGEIGYKEEVKKQIQQIRKYFLWKEATTETALFEAGVETVEEMDENDRLALELNLMANSPFAGTDYFYNTEELSHEKILLNASMEHNISIPRKYKGIAKEENGKWVVENSDEMTHYYDEQFKKIESNKDVYDYYKIVQEELSTIINSFPADVQDKLFVNSLPQMRKSYSEILSDNNIPLFKKLWNVLTDLLEKIKLGFGVNPEDTVSYQNIDVITGQAESTINDSFISNSKQKINQLYDIEVKKINNLLKKEGLKQKVRKNNTFSVYQLPFSVIKLISEKTNIPPSYEAVKAKFGERVPLGNIIYKSVTADLVEDSSTDLPKLIKYFSMMASEYTARQELLPYMEMMKQHYMQIKKPTTNKQKLNITNVFGEDKGTGLRTRANTQMEDWFERVILGNRTAKDSGIVQDKEVDIEKAKQNLKSAITGRLLSKEDKRIRKELDDLIQKETDSVEIEKLIKMRNQLGRKISASAAVDNFLNYIRFLGLGWNLSSSITNYAEGQIANMIIAANGDHFEPHHYYRALNIVKGSFFKNFTGNSALTSKGAKKLRVLMDRYNVLQDSTNELQKASVKTSLSKLDKVAPMELNKRTEYLNQAPLMISVMLNTEITGKNGQKSNAWDAIDVNGKLKPEFRTEENINTWEKGTGDTFNNFKSVTGQAIGMAHGMGYDNLRGMLVKKHSLGRMVMMFKTWVGSQLYTRFASERDDIELGVSGYKGRYRSFTRTSGAVMGTIVGISTGGFALGALGAVAGSVISKVNGTSSNMTVLGELAFLTKAIARKMIGMPVNFVGSTFTGKQVMNEFVGYEKLLKDGKFTERDMKNMRALVTEMSLILTWTLLTLVAKGLFWDDDDDEASDKRIAHNLIVNRTLQLLSSATTYLQPQMIWKNIIGEVGIFRWVVDVIKYTQDLQEWLEGNDTITAGINKGESKSMNSFYKIALPSVAKDSYFGFSKQMERQFEKKYYDDLFWDNTKKANRKIQVLRNQLRAELEERGIPEKKITKILNKRLPLLKDIKNPNTKD